MFLLLKEWSLVPPAYYYYYQQLSEDNMAGGYNSYANPKYYLLKIIPENLYDHYLYYPGPMITIFFLHFIVGPGNPASCRFNMLRTANQIEVNINRRHENFFQIQ